jgi:hypothetical protein
MQIAAAIGYINISNRATTHLEKTLNLFRHGLTNYLFTDQRDRNNMMFKSNLDIGKARAMLKMME